MHVGEVGERDILQREDGSWLMDAGMSIQRFKDALDMREPLPGEEEEVFHTLAGFVITQLGRIPHTGETFRWDAYRFEVVDMDRNRVDKVIVARSDHHARTLAAEESNEQSSLHGRVNRSRIPAHRQSGTRASDLCAAIFEKERLSVRERFGAKSSRKLPRYQAWHCDGSAMLLP